MALDYTGADDGLFTHGLIRGICGQLPAPEAFLVGDTGKIRWFRTI